MVGTTAVRIAITSDVHYDPSGALTPKAVVQKLVRAIGRDEPDAVVVAGDIAHGFDGFRATLKWLSRLSARIAVVPGNHDVWRDEELGHSSDALRRKLLPEAVEKAGMVWLEGGASLDLGRVAVVGSAGWYDYSAVDPDVPIGGDILERIKKRFSNDAHWIDWPETDRTVAREMGQALLRGLDEVSACAAVESVVVVTHVPIIEEQIIDRPGDWHWGITRAYLGNLTLGKGVMARPKVKAIVSGHTHVGMQSTVDRPDGSTVWCQVVGSDYGAPAHVIIEV